MGTRLGLKGLLNEGGDEGGSGWGGKEEKTRGGANVCLVTE